VVFLQYTRASSAIIGVEFHAKKEWQITEKALRFVGNLVGAHVGDIARLNSLYASSLGQDSRIHVGVVRSGEYS
jgi:hypothetical protein